MADRDARQLIPRSSRRDELISSPRPSPDEIRRQIEESRQQITSSIEEIRTQVSTRVDRALDWRGWVRNHPHKSIGIAFGIGLYFGLR